ncbi:hypothetical protein [Bacteroides sp. 519]|uniref:hypothetical protein n=1 Tax=Bacteroides sp. 519 TaxID=2302937 RepID=UPI0013D782E3|nr:hypothetical protein [Bacteroides sp. 519]NDV57539.1 hypothetical protein [Bacteroides sp. 519]
MLKSFFTILVAILVSQTSVAQNIEEKEYSFLLMDSPARLFSMRQFDESSLSLYRLGMEHLNKITSRKISMLIQAGVSGLFFIPFTHEEGHRSILTHQEIGSISKPYFNKNFAAYVTGVSNNDLLNLRNNNMPVFIRLHTAGLESDYAMLQREATLLNLHKESKDVLWVEYFLRKTSLVTYYAMGLFKTKFDLKEETNELKRDIVGHDIYGAIRHLHRPDMEFSRYTDYKDLTKEEKRFAKRVGWRSLLNLIDPLIIGKTGFSLQNGSTMNFAFGYGMVPFGDYIDEHIWINTQKIKTHIYIRQFENHSTWFPAIGANFPEIKIHSNIIANLGIHGWQQPQNMEFIQSKGKWGGAVDILVKYRFSLISSKLKGISANIGTTFKTEGFLLEEMNLDKHIGIRLGTSLWF